MKIILNKLYTIYYTKFINRDVHIGFYSKVSVKFLKKITYKNKIFIEDAIVGANVTLNHGVKLIKQCELNGNVVIGRYTTVNGPSTRIQGDLEGVKIGNFCSIGSGVIIQEDNHCYDRATTYFIHKNIINNSLLEKSTKGKIIIGDDVWIGSNSIILSGVEVGRGCIIGAGSVVTKSIPPYSIAVGNPAKIIKKRFSKDTIEELERLKWWNWSESEIIKNKDFFSKTLK